MGVRYTHHDDLGDGKLRVFGRTDDGVPFDVVIRRDLFGGATFWAVMEAAGRERDKLASVIKARVGRTDSEE